MADHGTNTNNRGNVVATSASVAELVARASNGSAGNPRSVAIQNTHASVIAYVGFGADLTAANGWRLSPGESIALDVMYFDTLWVIGSGTGEVRVLILNAGGTSV